MRVQCISHVTMNSVNAVFAVPSAESASDGLIVSEVFPGPWVSSSDGHVVHCSLTSRTYSLRNDTREGFESHVNHSCRRFHIPTCHWRRGLRVDNGPGWRRNVNGFETASVCWNRRTSRTPYHVVDGRKSDAVHGVQGSLNLPRRTGEIKQYGLSTDCDLNPEGDVGRTETIVVEIVDC